MDMFSLEKDRDLESLLEQVRACRHCAEVLGHEPRPVLRVRSTAQVLIVGQAPGTKVHATGIPWNDPSGDRLRVWLDTDRETFYDTSRVAIIPIGLCYPGRHARGGDLPPRPECAERWMPQLLPYLPRLQLILLVGGYAQRWFLGDRAKSTLGETVRAWRDYDPPFLPTPHPSFRNNRWLQQNGWFEQDVLPVLRRRFRQLTG